MEITCLLIDNLHCTTIVRKRKQEGEIFNYIWETESEGLSHFPQHHTTERSKLEIQTKFGANPFLTGCSHYCIFKFLKLKNLKTYTKGQKNKTHKTIYPSTLTWNPTNILSYSLKIQPKAPVNILHPPFSEITTAWKLNSHLPFLWHIDVLTYDKRIYSTALFKIFMLKWWHYFFLPTVCVRHVTILRSIALAFFIKYLYSIPSCEWMNVCSCLFYDTCYREGTRLRFRKRLKSKERDVTFGSQVPWSEFYPEVNLPVSWFSLTMSHRVLKENSTFWDNE